MTRENNIFYNASGCPDPTAAEAIRKVDRMSFNPKPGEVWTLDDDRMIAIIGTYEGAVTFTQLLTDNNGYCDTEIRGRHVNSHILAYTWLDRLAEFAFALTDEEFATLKNAICSSLNLVNSVEDHKAAIESLTADNIELRSTIESMQQNTKSSNESAILQAKFDTLRDMYNDLLSKVI